MAAFLPSTVLFRKKTLFFPSWKITGILLPEIHELPANGDIADPQETGECPGMKIFVFETKDDLIDYILNHMFHYLANEKIRPFSGTKKRSQFHAQPAERGHAEAGVEKGWDAWMTIFFGRFTRSVEISSIARYLSCHW